jgi:hypothetical protein
MAGDDSAGEAVGVGDDMHAATRSATSPADTAVDVVRRRRAEVIARAFPQASWRG